MSRKVIYCLVLLMCFVFIGLKIFDKMNPYSQDTEQQIILEENKAVDQSGKEANTENMNNYPQEINDVNNYFEIVETTVKKTNDFETVPSDTFLNNFVSFTWPDNVSFNPLYLDDEGVVYGEADASDNRSALFLGSYDCNTGEFKKLKDIGFDSLYASIKILIAYNESLIFEEYDQASGTAVYYLYDLKSGVCTEFKRSENVPPHYNIVNMSNDGIMFNWYDDLSMGYIIEYYSLKTKNFELIEEENSGYPVYHKGYWYYLRVDNDNLITQLIQYEMKTKTKKIIYETTGLNEYLFGLYGDGNNLILVMENDPLEKVYKIDVENGKFNYYFEDEWIEVVKIKNGIMTWSGTKTIENRSRPQNYLLDLNTDIHYLYADSGLMLSNSGIAWIDLKKPDNEIVKGQICINENSQLSYQIMNKR